MHVDSLADFIFLKNKNNAEVFLQLNGLEDIKDLFFFCLDLFCKGLVLLFGDNNRIDLETMTMEKFDIIRKKMELAGLDVHLQTEIPSENMVRNQLTTINLDEIDQKHGDLKLSDYCFTIHSPTLSYHLTFDLIMNRKHI